MADSDVGIKLVAEDASFKTAMANANQLIKQMAQECKEAASGVGDLGAKQEAYGNMLEAQKQKLELLNKAHEQAKAKLEELARAMEEAKESGDPAAIEKASEAYTRQATEVSKLETQMSACRTAINETTTGMEALGAEADDASGKQTEFGQKTDEATEKQGKFKEALGQIGETLSTLAKESFAACVEAIKAVGTAVVDATKQLVELATETAEFGDHIDKTSQKIGISAQAYQEWAYICERSGTSVDNLQGGMKTLSSVIADAGAGSEAAAKKLEAIGLSYDDLKNKSPDEQLKMVVGALQNMDAGAERTAAATDLLGRSATELGPVLNMTAKETQQLADEAHKYGMVMSDDAVKASASFEDSLSRMKETVTGVKSSLMSELLPGMSAIMDGFTDLIAGVDGADEKISQGIDQIVAAFDKLLPKVTEIIMRVVQMVAEKAPEIVNAIAEILPKIIDAIMKILPDVMKAGVEMIKAIAEGLSNALPDLIAKLPAVIEAVIKGIVENLSGLIDAGLKVIMALADGIIKALPDLIDRLPGIIEAVVKAIVDNLPKLLEAGIQIIVALSKAILEALPRLIATIPQIIASIIKAFTNVDFGEIGKHIWDGVTAVFKSIGQFFSEVVSAIKHAFDGIGKWFSSTFDTCYKGVQNAFSSVDKWMSEKFGAAWEGIKKAFAPFVDYFKMAWENVKTIFSVVKDVLTGNFQGAWDGIKRIWDNVKSYFQGVWEGIKSVFSGAFEAFKTIGGNLIEGVKAGITGAWDRFKSWFDGLWKSCIDGIKRFFGIASPSKLMAEMGGYVVEGFALGMDRNAGLIDKAAENAFGRLDDLAYVSPSVSGAYYNANGGAYGSAGAAEGAGAVYNLQIDGKTFARLTTPYIDRQQGRDWTRQVALGVGA